MTTQQIVFAGIGVVLLLYQFWPGIVSLFSRIRLPSLPASEPVVDEDAADFMAIKRLRERFKRLHCPEGLAAMDEATRHFFHEGQHA